MTGRFRGEIPRIRISFRHTTKYIEPMKPNFSPSRTKGFTLIEMLVTVTIIIILMGLSVGGFQFVTQKQANSQAEIQVKLLSNALEEYKLDNGNYPVAVAPATSVTSNDLYKLLYYNGANATPQEKIYVAQLDPVTDKQGWTVGTGAGVNIIDPWEAQYIYINGSDATAKNPDFDLISKGKDGILNTADDIRN